MSVKEFVRNKHGHKLMGDARGIVTKFVDRQAVWDWSASNGIIIEYQGSLSNLDLWYVKNEQDRMLFMLRWA